MSSETIGKRIAELRKRAGEKQEELAQILGCNRGSLANYETGKRTPDIETIIKIAKHYNTTTDYLFGLTKTSMTDVQIKPICDYFEVDENTIFGIRNLINKNKEYSGYFFKILFSSDFNTLLHHIYFSLVTRKKAESDLLKILHDKEKELNNDEKSLFNEYGEDGVAYSSYFDTFMDKLYFNEYKMQKSLFELVNGMCEECTISDLTENSNPAIIPSTKTLEKLNEYIDTISDCINQKIFYYKGGGSSGND